MRNENAKVLFVGPTFQEPTAEPYRRAASRQEKLPPAKIMSKQEVIYNAMHDT